jgi:hypothetical protein
MESYVEAALAPRKNDGQIKLYGEADFAGMSRAGRLVAECLDAAHHRFVRDFHQPLGGAFDMPDLVHAA